MGRFLPFIILLSLVALAAYAGIQSFTLIKKQPLTQSVSLPKINISLPNIFPPKAVSPTNTPQVTLIPTPTPNPGLNSFLESHLLNSSSTCVYELLGQDNNNYYLWAVCKNSTTSISIPVSVSLNLSSLKTPRAGDWYDGDLQSIFPDFIRSQPAFTDPSIPASLQKQLEK